MTCIPYTAEQLKLMLAEARRAYHDLQLGQAIVEMVDSNGERVRYSQANKNNLYQYILQLTNQLAALEPADCCAPQVMPPMGAFF